MPKRKRDQTADKKKDFMKCDLCDWSGKEIASHLRFDHEIQSILAPYNRPLDWKITADPTSKCDQAGRRWSILLACPIESKDPRTWFLLSAEQEYIEPEPEDAEESGWQDFFFELRCLNSEQRHLSALRCDQGSVLCQWMTPRYSDIPQKALVPKQATTNILEVRVLIRPAPLVALAQ